MTLRAHPVREKRDIFIPGAVVLQKNKRPVSSGTYYILVDVQNNDFDMSNNLTGKKIKNTYGRLLQYVSGAFYDGLGNPVSISFTSSGDWEDLNGVPANLVSSSNQIDYTQLQNLPDLGSLLENATVTNNVITFTRENGTTFDITIDTGSNMGGVTSYNDLTDIPVGIVSSSNQLPFDEYATTASLDAVSASFASTIGNLPTDTDTTYHFKNGLTETNNTASIDYTSTTNLINRATDWSSVGNSQFDSILIQDSTTNTVYEIGIKQLQQGYFSGFATTTTLNNVSSSLNTNIEANALSITNLTDDVNDLEDNLDLKLNTTDFNAYTASQATVSSSFDSRLDALEGATPGGIDYSGPDNVVTDAGTFSTGGTSETNDRILLHHDGDEQVQDPTVSQFKTSYNIQDSTAYQTDSSSFDSRLDNLEGANYIPVTEGGHTTTTAGDYKGDTLNLPTATLELGKIYAYNQGTFALPVVASGSSNVDDSLIVGAVNVDSSNGVLTRGTFTTSQSLSTLTNGSPLYISAGSGLLITESVSNIGDVDMKVGYVLDNTTNLIYFSPETAKKKEPEVVSSGSGGGVTPTDPEICYQRITPQASRISYVTGDTGWHIQNNTYDYLMPSGNNIVFARLDNHASESQVRSGTFYGLVGDGSDLLGATILENDNAFGNKYRFTDDAGNPSDSSTAVIHQHVHFRNHSFTGATNGYIIDHLTGLGFHIDYYEDGGAFNMRASDGGVDWATWIGKIASANYLGYTDWRPYSVSEMAGTALGAYVAGGGLQHPWSDDFFTAEATQGGSTRFCALTGETATFNTSMFIYGEDTNTVDLTDDFTKTTGTTFTQRIMNIFMIRTHY